MEYDHVHFTKQKIAPNLKNTNRHKPTGKKFRVYETLDFPFLWREWKNRAPSGRVPEANPNSRV